MTQPRDWRVLYPSETANSLEGTCTLCPEGWRGSSLGYLVDISGTAWAHLTCVALRRGDLSSPEYLNWILDGAD